VNPKTGHSWHLRETKRFKAIRSILQDYAALKDENADLRAEVDELNEALWYWYEVALEYSDMPADRGLIEKELAELRAFKERWAGDVENNEDTTLALTLAQEALSYAFGECKRLGKIPVALQQVQAAIDRRAALAAKEGK